MNGGDPSTILSWVACDGEGTWKYGGDAALTGGG